MRKRAQLVVVAACVPIAMTLAAPMGCATTPERHAVDCMRDVVPAGPGRFFTPAQVPRGACSDEAAECRFGVSYMCSATGRACPVDGERCRCTAGQWVCRIVYAGGCECFDDVDASSSGEDAGVDAGDAGEGPDAGDDAAPEADASPDARD